MISQDLIKVHHQLLEEDIVNTIAEVKKIDIRKALDIFYRSRLVKEIEAGLYGLDCMDSKWLAYDLIENEPELFEQ